MRNYTNNRKTTKQLNLPAKKGSQIERVSLPFNGKLVDECGFSFSFSCFDKTHKLFNLGDITKEGTLPSNWYIDLLDCLKSVSSMTFEEAKRSLHDLHPVDWNNTNAQMPASSDQCEYWQFRINKAKGRIIGFLIDEVFYVVWLDPHHNLTDSEGYGTATYYRAAKSTYQQMQEYLEEQYAEIERLRSELATAENLLEEKCNSL